MADAGGARLSQRVSRGGGFVSERLNQARGQTLSFTVTHSLPQAQATPVGQVSSLPSPGLPRHLNPLFGAWLMGWPSTWVIAEPHASSALETELFRSALQLHLSCLLGEPEFSTISRETRQPHKFIGEIEK